MITDIDTKHYYIKFQQEVDVKRKEYLEELEEYIKLKDKLLADIDKYKNTYAYNITKADVIINTNIENLNEQYINNLNNCITYNDSKTRLFAIILKKYIRVLRIIYSINLKIELLDKRKNITPRKYDEYLSMFYRYGVHKCVLLGFAYSFKNKFGKLIINRWRLPESKLNKKTVDYHATNIRKKELLAKGLMPYNKEDAEIAKAKGIKYNGVPYVVYKHDEFYYEITIIDSLNNAKNKMKFKPITAINYKLRGYTQKEIAEGCKTEEDVFNLPCDISHKLAVYKYFDKTSYLNFIRNEKQDKLAIGTHSSKNRQRFQSRQY